MSDGSMQPLAEARLSLPIGAPNFRVARHPESEREAERTHVQGADTARAMNELMDAVAARRDRAAFAVLFDYFAPRVRAYSLRFGCNGATAEELTQDVMLTIWRRADRFDPCRAGVGTWIFTITRNKCIDALRRERRLMVDLDDPELISPRPATDVFGPEREQRLKQAIALLPAKEAELLHMAYFEDKSRYRIAVEQRLPLGTVKTRLRRALARLRRSLKKRA